LVSDASGKVIVSPVTSTELSYLDGLTASLPTLLSFKQDVVTGGASSVVANNLSGNKALLSDASGKVAVSSITNVELSRLAGATSALQPQITGIIDGTTSLASVTSVGLIMGAHSLSVGTINLSPSVGDIACQALKSTSAALTGVLTAASASLTGVLSCSYVTQTAPPVGRLLNMASYDDSEAGWTDKTITSTTQTSIGNFTYTPVSTSSKILVTATGHNVEVLGGGNTQSDGDYIFRLLVVPDGGSTSTVAEVRMAISANDRVKGSLNHLRGVYTNSALTPLTFDLTFLRNSPSGSTDDNMEITRTNYVIATVMEFQR
jgi:hypothetical protein